MVKVFQSKALNMLRLFFISIIVSAVVSEKAKIGILEQNIKTVDGNEFENEIISVELKKPNEDIKFVAQVRIHLKEGNVHINGHRLEHNQVHHIRMMVLVSDIVNGVKQVPKRKAVQLRVMIEETQVNGVRRLLVEEEFTAIGENAVEQIDVHQIIWESNVRKPITTVKLSESKIHTKPRRKDNKMFFHDEESRPHLPGHGLEYEKDGRHHHHRHHCRHHHHHHHHHRNSTFFQKHSDNAKCWYHSLSWKSKILLFSIGFFGLLTAVVCCGLCAKRRQARRKLEVTAPMDDSVNVDANDDINATKDGGKKLDDNKYEFHFEFDNSVVIDDKKALVEEA